VTQDPSSQSDAAPAADPWTPSKSSPSRKQTTQTANNKTKTNFGTKLILNPNKLSPNFHLSKQLIIFKTLSYPLPKNSKNPSIKSLIRCKSLIGKRIMTQLLTLLLI